MNKKNDKKVKQLRLARETLRHLTAGTGTGMVEVASQVNSCQTVGRCCTDILSTTLGGALSPM